MSRAPSQFWRQHTPSNSLVMTWQNLALWQDPSRPVSFQAEIFEDGGAAFRYDLYRAGRRGLGAAADVPQGGARGVMRA